MIDLEPGNYEYTDLAQHGDQVFLIGYQLGGGDDMSVWTTAWIHLEPDRPPRRATRGSVTPG